MRSATSVGALIAMMALLGGLPATSHAQTGGWATSKGEIAFTQNRFPELKGLTYSQEDQRKAINLCSQYGGGSQSQLCNLATEFYMKEGQQEADAQRQKDASAAAQAAAQTEQSSKDEETPASPIAPQEVAATPSPIAPQEVAAIPLQASSDAGASNVATACSSADAQTIHQCVVYIRAEKRASQVAEMPAKNLENARLQAQAEAASEQKAMQQEKHDESSALYWKVGILGFLVSNVILFVGAAKKKFVVFYDKWDIIHAVLIFVSPACGYFLAWLIDVGTSGESFLHPICIGLGWVLAAWFSAVTLISSIRHNKNVTIGIFVGLMKIYTVILIASIALLSFTMLNSSMGTMPKDMDTLEKMQRVKQDKENGVMWAVVAAGLLYLLVNGAEVYEERGWNHPS